MMRGAWLALVLLIACPTDLFAQHEEHHLTDQQQLGKRLYEQSCAVCHTRPTLISQIYGPELSKDPAGGNEATMRETITNGTPSMPAFKYTYEATHTAANASK